MGNVVAVFSSLMNNTWMLMTSTCIPGTSVSIGYALMGIVLAVFSIRLFSSALGLQINPFTPFRGMIQEAKNEDKAEKRRESRRQQGRND